MKNENGFAAVGILFFFLICAAIGIFCWTYTINTWLVYFGKPQSIVWWHGLLLGLCPIIRQITIPAAVITFILMLFLV